jgi:single-stranded DNA-binding protein
MLAAMPECSLGPEKPRPPHAMMRGSALRGDQVLSLFSLLDVVPDPFVARVSRGINKVILLGNAGAEPKTRTYNDGTASVTFFPLATNQIYTNKSGERVNKAQWHNVVIYNDNLSQIAHKTIKKGYTRMSQHSPWHDCMLQCWMMASLIVSPLVIIIANIVFTMLTFIACVCCRSLVYVEGALSTRSYRDASGAEKTICEVVLPKYRGELNVLSRREADEHEADLDHDQDHVDPEHKEDVTIA